MRFDYGSIVPWVRRVDGVLLITAGPDTLELTGSLHVKGEGLKTVARIHARGRAERIALGLNYRASHLDTLPTARRHGRSSSAPRRCGSAGPSRCKLHGRWDEPVLRSLITLKALIYRPTGGIVAAPTTSLPEQPGGVRNWDYRYCWLRDATFTLNALLLAGYVREATAWREWLLRAVAGSPKDLQILYGVTGVRRLDEYEIAWLPGYQGAAPVRIGNAASRQFQLDVYGEVMDTLAPGAAQRTRSGAGGVESAGGAARVPRGALEAARRRDLGGARPAAALHPLEDHGVGGIRPGHQGCGARRAGGAARALARRARGDPRGGVRAGIRRTPQTPSCNRTNRRIWMRACC